MFHGIPQASSLTGIIQEELFFPSNSGAIELWSNGLLHLLFKNSISTKFPENTRTNPPQNNLLRQLPRIPAAKN